MNKNLDCDYILRVTAANGYIRGFFATSKNVSNEAYKAHKTSPVVSVALSRLLTATAIIGQTLKHDDHKITLIFNGDGPMQGILATSDSYGNVKGYPYVANVDLPLKPSGNLDVGSAIGYGSMKIIKDIGLKDAYTGHIPLISGEIADDLTYYYAKSEQIPTSVALSASVDTDYSIKCAGGFMIQVLPGASDETIDIIENNLAHLPKLTKMLEEGQTPEDIANHILGELNLKIHDKTPIKFICDCSYEKVKQAFITIGKKDLIDIYENDKSAELNCHFCNKKYQFTEEDLKEIIDDL
ncbi:MAG: Hsp33 family molecular chaperone HslO [Lachnospirales bacterium]